MKKTWPSEESCIDSGRSSLKIRVYAATKRSDSEWSQTDISEGSSEENSSGCNSSSSWDKAREKRKRELLEGLGSTYCVLPKFVWKYFGKDNDSELTTRKKCVAVILGAVLTVLLLAILLGTIVGVATSANAEGESTIRFNVKPGVPAHPRTDD